MNVFHRLVLMEELVLMRSMDIAVSVQRAGPDIPASLQLRHVGLIFYILLRLQCIIFSFIPQMNMAGKLNKFRVDVGNLCTCVRAHTLLYGHIRICKHLPLLMALNTAVIILQQHIYPPLLSTSNQIKDV